MEHVAKCYTAYALPKMTVSEGLGTIPAMLKSLRRLLTRHQTASRAVCVENLERRSLLNGDVTPPTLVKEQLIGSDPRRMTGVVLTFSEPLDQASAENLEHFRVGRRTSRRQRYDFEDDDIRSQRSRGGLIRFESAVYNPADLTVTLTAVQPFNITRRFRTIRVLGRENLTVRDLAGNRIDGNGDGTAGGDAIERFTFQRGGRVQYSEFDADRVSLRLSGPGIVWVLRKTRDGRVLERGDAVRVFIDRADPSDSILTGKVVDQGPGDGVAVIDELVNASTAQVQIATDPSFQIRRSIP